MVAGTKENKAEERADRRFGIGRSEEPSEGLTQKASCYLNPHPSFLIWWWQRARPGDRELVVPLSGGRTSEEQSAASAKALRQEV